MCSSNIQDFVNETGVFDVFQEINGVELDQREATHECTSNCVDYVLAKK